MLKQSSLNAKSIKEFYIIPFCINTFTNVCSLAATAFQSSSVYSPVVFFIYIMSKVNKAIFMIYTYLFYYNSGCDRKLRVKISG